MVTFVSSATLISETVHEADPQGSLLFSLESAISETTQQI
jgi:hypothetical protein